MQRITRSFVEARIATIARYAADLGVTDLNGGPIVTLHVQSDSGTNRLFVHCYDDGPEPWRRLASQGGRGYSSGVHNLKNGTMRELSTYLDGVLEMLHSQRDVLDSRCEVCKCIAGRHDTYCPRQPGAFPVKA